jgi:hypothetical protein
MHETAHQPSTQHPLEQSDGKEQSSAQPHATAAQELKV